MFFDNKKLWEVCDVISWQSPESKYYNESGEWLPFFQWKTEFTNKYIWNPRTWTKYTTKESIKNDILMSVRAPVWPVNINWFDKICIWRWLCAIRPSNKVELDYLFNFLLSIQEQLTWNRGSVFASINRSQIENIEIPLPPLETQKAIVAKLDQIFAELDQTKSEIQKNLDNTDELWKSALNQAFQGDWEMKKLGEICENFDNQRKPVTAGDRKKWTYPYYWASWIVDYVDNYIYDWDYLLVSEDWANLLARSTPIAFSISWKNWVNNHAHVLKFWNNTTQLFVERFLNFIDLSDYVTWSAQPKLNQKNLNDIEIPVPPLSEQEKIVEHLDQVSKEVKALKSQYQSQLDNLEELKKSVLDKAFRWELGE